MDTRKENKTINNGNIIPQKDLLTFENLATRWNLPDEVVIDKLFKYRPPVYVVLRERYNETYGPHFYCSKIDYDNELVDYTGEFLEPLYETIKRQVVFNLKDIKQLENVNDELFCESNTTQDKHTTINFQTLNTKSLKERLTEFDNCTCDEVDLILNTNPGLKKGPRNCLLAAKFYLSGESPMKNIYFAVVGNKHIKDPSSQTRRWLREAKKILPGLRSKFGSINE